MTNAPLVISSINANEAAQRTVRVKIRDYHRARLSLEKVLWREGYRPKHSWTRHKKCAGGRSTMARRSQEWVQPQSGGYVVVTTGHGFIDLWGALPWDMPMYLAAVGRY